MATICYFYGILVQMFVRDHPPPHIHVFYAENEAQIDIRDLSVIHGALPRRAMALVLEWAADHREELMENWKRCEQRQQPRKIKALK